MQLYTVGHSTHPIEYFIGLLKQNNVQYIIDVRSTPYSKYASQYNSEELKTSLLKEDILYFHMGKQFGARQEKRKYYPDGYLDFELFRESEDYKKGLLSIKEGLKRYNIALMCTEKNPIDCHRAIMVGRGFELDGTDVKHILHDGSLMTQKELNDALKDMYFPDRNQLSIYDAVNKNNDAYYLREAYRLRNKDIGYRFGSDKEGEMPE